MDSLKLLDGYSSGSDMDTDSVSSADRYEPTPEPPSVPTVHTPIGPKQIQPETLETESWLPTPRAIHVHIMHKKSLREYPSITTMPAPYTAFMKLSTRQDMETRPCMQPGSRTHLLTCGHHAALPTAQPCAPNCSHAFHPLTSQPTRHAALISKLRHTAAQALNSYFATFANPHSHVYSERSIGMHSAHMHIMTNLCKAQDAELRPTALLTDGDFECRTCGSKGPRETRSAVFIQRIPYACVVVGGDERDGAVVGALRAGVEPDGRKFENKNGNGQGHGGGFGGGNGYGHGRGNGAGDGFGGGNGYGRGNGFGGGNAHGYGRGNGTGVPPWGGGRGRGVGYGQDQGHTRGQGYGRGGGPAGYGGIYGAGHAAGFAAGLAAGNGGGYAAKAPTVGAREGPVHAGKGLGSGPRSAGLERRRIANPGSGAASLRYAAKMRNEARAAERMKEEARLAEKKRNQEKLRREAAVGKKRREEKAAALKKLAEENLVDKMQGLMEDK